MTDGILELGTKKERNEAGSSSGVKNKLIVLNGEQWEINKTK